MGKRAPGKTYFQKNANSSSSSAPHNRPLEAHYANEDDPVPSEASLRDAVDTPPAKSPHLHELRRAVPRSWNVRGAVVGARSGCQHPEGLPLRSRPETGRCELPSLKLKELGRMVLAASSVRMVLGGQESFCGVGRHLPVERASDRIPEHLLRAGGA